MKKCITYLFLVLFLFSCKEEINQTELLVQAQNIVETDPSKALKLLSSISNPEEMDKDNYMQYIVAKVQAKYKTYQDISTDTLIFEALKYFNNKNNFTQLALASYYSGCIYHEMKIADKELECNMLTTHYAKLVNMNLLTAKSLHSIGNIYYDKYLMDSAIYNLRQALHFYSTESETEEHQLEVIKMMGVVNESQNKLDSAYTLLNRGLTLSKMLENKKYETTFTHLLGIVLSKQKNYEVATIYLHKALSQTSSQEEYNRICLSCLKLYNTTNRLDSAKHYSIILEKHLPEITYNYTLKESYTSLAEYYEKIGNYRIALHYTNLLNEVNQEINEVNNQKKLAEAKYKYATSLHKKELESQRSRSNLIYTIIALVSISVIAITYMRIRIFKQKQQVIKAENKALEEQVKAKEKELKREKTNFSFLNKLYWDISNEWGEIDNEVQDLAEDLGATEEPELYRRIRQVFENCKQTAVNQFINLAKDHFDTLPYGEKALSTLKEKELLLYMLYYSGNKRMEVANMLNVHPKKENMLYRKLHLRNKLVQSGMPQKEVEELLFTEDEVNKL